MTLTEYRAILSLSLVYAVRLLGLFIILPVFTPFAQGLIGSNPLLIGVALGAYGLTQAFLQIPFGVLSDRWGRKPVIAMGLCLLAAGSAIAAVANTITGVILGRLLQGSGAIGSTIAALLADLTHEENRSKAMAIIGISVAISFFIAMILGSVLSSRYSVKGIFWLTAILALVAILILFTLVPKVRRYSFHADTQTIPKQLKTIIDHSELFIFDISIFISHAILICTFLALPVLLVKSVDLQAQKQWALYLPVLLISSTVAFSLVVFSERRRFLKQGVLLAIVAIGVAELLLSQLYDVMWGLAGSLTLFFTAFSFLEAVLPSLVSKTAPAGLKGTAMGIFGSAQFLGFFVGGAMGGWLLKHHEMDGIFLFTTLLAIIWLLIAANMKQPRYLATHIVHIGSKSEAQLRRLKLQLAELPGVVDVALFIGDQSAYLKVDQSIFKPASLEEIGV